MKRIISIAFIGVAFLALAACDDDTEVKVIDTPVVTLSPSSVTLSSEAVSNYTINYTVTNAQSGATVSASADVSWVSGLDYSVSGQVRFSVAENTSGNLRTANVTLDYIYDGGSVSTKAAVIQYGVSDPVLSVDPNAVVANARGGSYSFGYSIENPIAGEAVSCTTDVNWIYDFDYSNSGIVSFAVNANSGEELRTGTITVTYASLSKQVTVVQDRPGSGDSSVDISEFVGTYSCSGEVCDPNGTGVAVERTWTMKIYNVGGRLLISGLVPDTVDYYPYTDAYGSTNTDFGPYTAFATVSGNDIYVSVPQFTGYTASNGVQSGYIVWVACAGYTYGSSGYGWYYDVTSGDIIFEYNFSASTWVSDFGMMLAISTSSSSASSLLGFMDAFGPGMTITKTSNTTSTDAAPSSLKSLEERVFNNSAMPY